MWSVKVSKVTFRGNWSVHMCLTVCSTDCSCWCILKRVHLRNCWCLLIHVIVYLWVLRYAWFHFWDSFISIEFRWRPSSCFSKQVHRTCVSVAPGHRGWWWSSWWLRSDCYFCVKLFVCLFCPPACLSQRDGDPSDPQVEPDATEKTSAGSKVSPRSWTAWWVSSASALKHSSSARLCAGTFTSLTSSVGTSLTWGSTSTWPPTTRSGSTCSLTDWFASPAASETPAHCAGFYCERTTTQTDASVSRYSSSMKTLSNKFMHLTNYSVNKKNSEYQTNSDDKACQGHKW